MKYNRMMRETARVMMHLNGGFTRIVIERFQGLGLADGGELDIPTEQIPYHLRPIGSRFIVNFPRFSAERQDSIEDIRAAMAEPYLIEELASGE